MSFLSMMNFSSKFILIPLKPQELNNLVVGIALICDNTIPAMRELYFKVGDAFVLLYAIDDPYSLRKVAEEM